MRADVIFRNAEIHDGTGAAPLLADLAVTGGRIAAIAATVRCDADETVDAAGLAVAPGFIDVHTHDDAAVMTAAAMTPKVSQGVTTVVTGNCGISLAPTPLTRRSAPVPPLDLLGGAAAFAHATFADYLAALDAARPPVNVVPLVGHTVLRARAMADLDAPANAAEVAAMRDDLDAALAAGAQGLSTGLAYPPARAATTEEILTLAQDIAAAGALWTTHMRDERSGVVAAVAETIDIARRAGVRTLISHHKCCGQAAFGLSRTTLEMIETARAEIRLDLDVYPYTASSTVLLEGFAQDSRRVLVSWSDPHPEMAGRALDAIAAEWGVPAMDALDRLRPGGAIYFQMADGDLERILAYPPSLIGSDGLPRDRRPHPRLWGTFPRVLGHYARDRGLLSLERAIAKMTGQTAATLGLVDRGTLAPGMAADLVLFNPTEIADLADYDTPDRPAHGIHRVLVNGMTAWDGHAVRPGAGRVLRRTPTAKG